MAQYLLNHWHYLNTLDFTTIERCEIDWSVHRIPFNARERFTRLAANVPLTPEEFENEMDSPYKTKKYHYNYRHPSELTEENLHRTFINMQTTALLQNKDMSVREDVFNKDGINSKEREEAMLKMKL